MQLDHVPTPYDGIKPDGYACGVNSVDADGKISGGIYRAQSGQLVCIDRHGKTMSVSEKEFDAWVKDKHKQ